MPVFSEIIAGVAEPSVMSLSGYPEGISRYASVDVFNAARMGEAREGPWSEILAESDVVFDKLIATAERVSAENLSLTADFFWPDIGGTVPCGIYLLMEAAHHYQVEHLPEITAGVRSS